MAGRHLATSVPGRMMRILHSCPSADAQDAWRLTGVPAPASVPGARTAYMGRSDSRREPARQTVWNSHVKSRIVQSLTVLPLALAAVVATGASASAHNVPYTKYGTYSYYNCYTNGNVGVQYKSWHNFYCSQSLAGWDLWVQY